MPRFKLYEDKPDVFPTVEHVEEQLRHAYDDDMRAVLAFAQKHAQKPGTKVTRRKEKQGAEEHRIIHPSKIIDAEGREISPSDASKIPDFRYSAINHEGEFYVLLRENLFYHDCFYDEAGHRTQRGLRRVKLVRDIHGHLFTVKILELPHFADSIKQTKLEKPIIQEMSSATQYYQERMPHKTALQRKKQHTVESSKETVKYYLIQPYTGLDSNQLIHAQPKRLSPLQMLDLAIQYMQLVYTLHEQSLIHRDLKPANYTVEILPDGELNVSVIDFDCARLFNAEKTDKHGMPYYNDGHYVGTPEYLPPFHLDRIQKQLLGTLASNKAPGYYNFATDMYAAATSANYVLKKLKSMTLSPEENTLYEKLETFIHNIRKADTFNCSHPHLPDREAMQKQLEAFSRIRKTIKVDQLQSALSQPEITLYQNEPLALDKADSSNNTTLIQQLNSLPSSSRVPESTHPVKSNTSRLNTTDSANTSNNTASSNNSSTDTSNDASHYDTQALTPPSTPSRRI